MTINRDEGVYTLDHVYDSLLESALHPGREAAVVGRFPGRGSEPEHLWSSHQTRWRKLKSVSKMFGFVTQNLNLTNLIIENNLHTTPGFILDSINRPTVETPIPGSGHVHSPFVIIGYPVHQVSVNEYFPIDFMKLNEVLMHKTPWPRVFNVILRRSTNGSLDYEFDSWCGWS